MSALLIPSTDSDDDEYISSTEPQNSENETGNFPKDLLEDAFKSPDIPIQEPIESFDFFKDKNKEIESNFTPFYFECENNLNENSIVWENLDRLQKYFQSENEIIRPKSKLKTNNKQTNVFDSRLLTRNKYKKTTCKFCEREIVSQHFARHLERNHSKEKEVKEIFSFKLASVERKRLLLIIRNEGNLEGSIRGHIIPKKYQKEEEVNENNYAICKHCKGYYKRLSLSRHIKKCFAKNTETSKSHSQRPLTDSLVYRASKKKYGDILNKLAVKKEIFGKMLPDHITAIVMEDILLILYGEDLLKKTKNKRSVYHISNQLRECGKFLIEMRRLGSYNDMLSILKPENFDNAIEATKIMSRYDAETKSFGAASLALHFGTTLKKLSEVSVKFILRKKIVVLVPDIEKCLTDIKRFKELVESQWTLELGSLALKDLSEKSAIKPKLLPLTEDIKVLKTFVEQAAESAYKELQVKKSINSYKILIETTLVLTVLHNRKRVGDIQYLDVNSYSEQINAVTNATVQTEMGTSLSENEKILTQHYKRIISIGKGSRPVTILIPKNIQKYYSTYPRSVRWINGCTAMRKYAKQCGAKNPELLTSCRLRKHIATVTQILSLRNNEIDQLAKFMGHTSKTHETFYKLPQDIYQVAKVSKILQLMENGNMAEFKNKCLDEIEIDMEDIELDRAERHKDISAEHIENCSIVDTEEFTENSSPLGKDTENNIKLPDIDKVDVTNVSTVKKTNRKKWNKEQKKIMLEYFTENLKKKRAPKKKQCEDFLTKYKTKFEGVSWLRVKTFVYNEYREK